MPMFLLVKESDTISYSFLIIQLHFRHYKFLTKRKRLSFNLTMITDSTKEMLVYEFYFLHL